MSEQVKMGLIIAAAIVIAAAAYIYFSPYQSCVRARMDGGTIHRYDAQIACARYSN